LTVIELRNKNPAPIETFEISAIALIQEVIADKIP